MGEVWTFEGMTYNAQSAHQYRRIELFDNEHITDLLDMEKYYAVSMFSIIYCSIIRLYFTDFYFRKKTSFNINWLFLFYVNKTKQHLYER